MNAFVMAIVVILLFVAAALLAIVIGVMMLLETLWRSKEEERVDPENTGQQGRGHRLDTRMVLHHRAAEGTGGGENSKEGEDDERS